MAYDQKLAESCEVTPEEARLALAAVIGDEHFLASERTRSLLKFLAEETLAGRGDRIKAYTIAVDFLGRSTHFDPATDPIVRVEASRLRSALHAYYQRYSDALAVYIDVPKGTYAPQFHRKAVDELPVDEPVLSIPVIDPAAIPTPGTHRWRTGALVTGLLGAAVAAAYLSLPNKLIVTARPLLDLQVESRDSGRSADAARVQFERAAMQQETVRLTSNNFPQPSATDVTVVRSTYALQIAITDRSGHATVTWRLSAPSSGETLLSGEEIASDQSNGIDTLMWKVARTVAGADGAIPMAELAHSSAGDVGYPCILRAQQATSARSTQALQEARTCLEKTIKVSPRYSDARISLATLLMFIGRVSGDPRDIQQGLAMADEASALAPTSALAAISQAVTRYQAGQPEAAVAAAKRAVELGELNAFVLSRASATIYLCGQWQEGLDLAKKALQMAGTVEPTGASLVMMLDAYRNGDYELAISRVDAMTKPDPVATLVKLSSLFRLGRTTEVARTYEQARSRYPDFEKVLASVTDSERFEETLIHEWREPLVEVGKTYGSISSNDRSSALAQSSR